MKSSAAAIVAAATATCYFNNHMIGLTKLLNHVVAWEARAQRETG